MRRCDFARDAVAFIDHFSGRSREYARARPTYPDALYRFVADVAPDTGRVWDCATGNGQAAIGLARYFRAVEATDASADQVRHALPAPKVRYTVQPAERTDFAPASFDAVCVAQALHWFDRAAFYEEVRRVLRPRGVLAVWGYDRMRTHDRFDDAFEERILGELKPYWPAQNRLLWAGYKPADFPFERVEAPAFEMRVAWTFDAFRAYVETWSGTRKCLEALGDDALDAHWEALRAAWGDAASREFVMPMHFLCGRHGSW